ncbi:MAG: hypothetical protein IKI90_07095 [Treponema sp.]|nr:hypothetical protein [Treponema sp.]
MKELEDLVRDYQEKRIGEKEAGRILVEHIYRNRIWFGLKKLEDDELHDFLLDQYSMFSRIFKSYDHSKGDFTCYLFGNINRAYNGWKRESARDYLKIRTLEEIECTRLRAEKSYEFTDESLFVCDFPPEHVHTGEKVRHNISYKKRLEERGTTDTGETAADRFRQDAVLVLMVKSWYLIESELLEKISMATGIHAEDLLQIIQKTRKIMESKKELINHTKMKRDESYYYMERYRLESNFPYAMRLAYTINRKRTFHSGNWQRLNDRLKSQNKILVPSNRIVAQVLGLQQRRVQYIMDKMIKNMDIISLNWYYTRHEDIFGKRKLE